MHVTVGQKAMRSLTLTKEHVQKYAEITGDYNPLHFDEVFAAKTKFGRLVVQGGLTTGILNALVATDLPGPEQFSSAMIGSSRRLFLSATPSRGKRRS